MSCSIDIFNIQLRPFHLSCNRNMKMQFKIMLRLAGVDIVGKQNEITLLFRYYFSFKTHLLQISS